MGNLQLSSGSLFGNRFEIERPAGSGGMGTVYRARDRYSGNLVALKLLHSSSGGRDEAERFTREAQLLSELHHPGIVAYVAHGQMPDGQRFLAMEWLEGEDLGHRLLRGPLPLRDCLLLVDRVAEALALAHQRAIIHRDLKPTNIFLCNGEIGRAKILDFGIARRIVTSHAMTKTGMVVGTPEYMAPEQARGSRELLPAADLFSIGCVLYECLTGQPPFVADHIAAVLVRILFEEPDPIEERRPGIPAALVRILGRLLTKDPTQRLADAAALRSELLAVAEAPEPSCAATLAGSSAKAQSFAENEQSLFSVVLAAPPEDEASLDATLHPRDLLQGAERQALLQSLQQLGVTADFLATGALVVTVPTLGNAMDQASQAARAALLIKECWPAAVVSMATGRGLLRGRTAVGEVVEVAARSLKAGSQPSPGNTPTGVLLDTLSAKLLAGRFAQTTKSGGAILLYEERDTDASRPLLGKPTPCVGREAELGTLESQLGGCIEESESRVMLFTAPPGVGKSRLRHEFLRRVEKRSDPVTLLLGRGDMMSAGAAYGILRTALHKLCGIFGGEPIETQRECLRTRIAQHLNAADPERVVLFIGELCNVPFPETGKPMLQTARQNPKIMQDWLRRSVLDFFAAECAAAPVVLVLDDLQWGDELTVSVVDELLRELVGAPFFVLAFGRPEVHETFPKLWPTHKVQEVPLKALSKKACERLVVQVLGREVGAEAIARAVEQSAGNALFLEEIIRSIAEGKSETPSETVVAMLQARLSRLDSNMGRTVRAAAVFGQTFWRDGVAALLGLSATASELDNWLAALVDAELIRPHAQCRLREQSEYVFRHALVRDAAYSLLIDSDLLTGHRLAAEFLESAGEADFAVIAEHFQHGKDPLRAASHYLRAAEAAVDTYALEQSLRYVEAGVACGASGEELGRLRAIEAYVSFHVSQVPRLIESSMAALTLLRPGSRARGRALHAAYIGALLGGLEAQSRVPSLAAELVLTDPETGAEPAYAEALMNVGMLLCLAAPAEHCQPVLKRLEILTHSSVADSALLRYWLGTRSVIEFHSMPRTWAALKDAEEAFRLSMDVGDTNSALLILCMALVWMWRDLGDDDKALNLLESNRTLTQRGAGTVTDGFVLLGIAAIQAARADLASHEQAIERANEVLRRWPEQPTCSTWAYDTLARVALQQGHFAKAETAARQAVASMEHIPNFCPNIRAPLIHALLAQGRTADAREVATAGLAHIEQFGGVGHAEVELRLTISEAFHAASEPERARLALTDTLRQIQLRADDIADPFWRNSYLTQNPYCVRAQALGQKWSLNFVVS